MDKITNLFEYFRQCPKLKNLWSIGATEEAGVSVILPHGASPAAQYEDEIDINGDYHCERIPYPSVYEDYQINCYQVLDTMDGSEPKDNLNVLSYNEVQSVCKWIQEQDELENYPDIGEEIVSIECNPFIPQVRYVNTQENIIAYFLTIRIRYVNKQKRKPIERHIEYEADD